MSTEKKMPHTCCQSAKNLQQNIGSRASTSEASSSSDNINEQKPQNNPTVNPRTLPITPKTRITIHYDCGFPNALYLRGEGAELSWEKGLLLKNVKSDEWIWETTKPFTTCQFKILINDHQFEIGENHLLTCGASVHYTPKFH